jgi:hypothetical protein
MDDLDVICRQFRIHGEEESIHTIIQQGDIVVRDVHRNMELAAQLMQERKNIVNAVPLPPEDLENQLFFFQIYPPVTWNILSIR